MVPSEADQEHACLVSVQRKGCRPRPPRHSMGTLPSRSRSSSTSWPKRSSTPAAQLSAHFGAAAVSCTVISG